MLDVIDDFHKIYKIKAPILKFLEKHCTKEATIRKILRELYEKGKIKKIKSGRAFKFKLKH